MHPRVAELVRVLDLAPHPEGGFFREIHRSSLHVRAADGRPERSAMTTIYYLLAAGQHGRWHAVASDEVWHLYEGEPLELFVRGVGEAEVRRVVLGPVGAGVQPAYTVPAFAWQAARPIGEYALAGCTVGPGFDYEDFRFLADDASAVAELARVAPDLVALV
jgi:predicted cupin superfamily sugar epimerase